MRVRCLKGLATERGDSGWYGMSEESAEDLGALEVSVSMGMLWKWRVRGTDHETGASYYRCCDHIGGCLPLLPIFPRL